MLDDTGSKNAAATAPWLSDQPGTWHEMNRALQDVSILLQYLGELPDARLLGYFTDTQAKLADSGARRSVPPCDQHANFLSRLLQIAAAFQTGRAELLPEGDRAQTSHEHQSGCGFRILESRLLGCGRDTRDRGLDWVDTRLSRLPRVVALAPRPGAAST